MKTHCILSLSLFFLSSLNILQAQVISGFGTKISISRSSFDIVNKRMINVGGHLAYLDYIEDAVLHPSIGIFAQSTITENLGLEAEILYLQKGASKTFNVFVTTAENPDGSGKYESIRSEINLSYLQFGLNLEPKIQLGSTPIFATIGPSLNYLISASNFPKEDVKNIVLGYNLGIGVSLNKLVNAPLFLELKYCGDFSPFYSPAEKYRNNLMLLNLGVTLW